MNKLNLRLQKPSCIIRHGNSVERESQSEFEFLVQLDVRLASGMPGLRQNLEAI